MLMVLHSGSKGQGGLSPCPYLFLVVGPPTLRVVHPIPRLLLITHYFICFFLFSLCSWPLKIPKEHYLAMGEVAKP